jgi:dihydrofolate reductase
VGRKLIFSMATSLDGYVNGPDGRFDWAAPDEELHRFHNRQTAEIGIHLLGRRLYETMVYWEAESDPSWGEIEREFAEIWKRLPKLVFSTTLDRVQGNAQLATAEIVGQVQALKAEEGEDIAVGGPGLAAPLIERDLIDEYHLFVNPVLAGGGTPFFASVPRPIDLELVETRTFSSRVVYSRYRRRASG